VHTTQLLQVVYWSNCPAVVMPIRSSSTSAGAGTMAAIATIWAVLVVLANPQSFARGKD